MQEDRRLNKERRQSSQPFSIRQIHGRRRGPRRVEDEPSVSRVSDFYSIPMLLGVIGVLFLCMADAHNTLLLIEAGAKELNPLMNVLLSGDPRTFVLCKMGLTGMGLLLIVGHEHKPIWRGFKTGHIVYIVLASYLSLVAYQSSLMPPYLPGWVFR